jgi:hypothetical protein
MSDNVIRFIKTPKKGQIVKVYTGLSPTFGKVTDVYLGETESGRLREKLAIRKLDRYYEAKDCDFCLDENKVAIFTGRYTS